MKQRGVSKKAITVIPKQYKSYRINNSEKDWLLIKKIKNFHSSYISKIPSLVKQ